jgi:NAD(P)H dehydrogenase (quinone)
MKKILIVYESRSGNVKEMAELIRNAITEKCFETKMLSVDEASNNDLLESDAIIIGSYTSYGILAGGTKEFFDKTISIHGMLQNKIGAAFASSGGFGGGNETTVLSILQMLLVHGMIIAGDSESPHYGVVSIGKADDQVKKACIRLANRVMELLNKIK